MMQYILFIFFPLTQSLPGPPCFQTLKLHFFLTLNNNKFTPTQKAQSIIESSLTWKITPELLFLLCDVVDIFKCTKKKQNKTKQNKTKNKTSL